jgi:Tol biopolymer transport system component/DNA-binding winged helix-turn-helix (wHTH) protein
MATEIENRTFQFGAFELHQVSGELRKNGVKLKLQGQPFQILILLLERSGELVRRGEIRSILWPDNTYVDFDNAISSAVWKIREALGDESENPRFVQTIARRGYRFVAPVFVRDQGAGLETHGPEEPATWDAATSTAQEQIEQPKVRPEASRLKAKTIMIAIVPAIALFSLVSGLFWFRFFRRIDAPIREPQTVPLTGLSGVENFPSFSPDGKQIAYVWEDEEGGLRASVYVKLIGSDAQLRLTPGVGGDSFPHWSPDGRYIAFCREAPGSTGDYIVSALGGPQRKITPLDACGNLDWLPDGRHLIVSQLIAARVSVHGAPYPLLNVEVDTGKRRAFTTPPAGSLGDASPLVSPDGKMLAFVRLVAFEAADLYLMRLDGGQPSRITFDGQAKWGLAWTADSREVVLAIRKKGTFRLWRVSITGGEPRAITSGAQDSYSPAIARHGDRLAYAVDRRDINLWMMSIIGTSIPRAGAPSRFIASKRGQADPRYSPDGRKIAFQSGRSGPNEIWISDADGQDTMQLTHMGGSSGSPRWSPDGSQIAFDSRPNGNPDIFVAQADGGVPRRVTNHTAVDVVPSWSRDGKWIYFASNRSGEFQIWKLPAATGESPATPAIQVTQDGGFNGFESLDGKYLYFAKGPSQPGLWRRVLIPATTAREEPVLASLRDWNAWTLSSHGIYFFDVSDWPEPTHGTKTLLKFFNLDSKQIYQLAVLGKPASGMDLSPDGRRLIYTQVDRIDRDLMLVENFR